MDQSTITLVSGGNRGLGLEIARGLARAGHHVLIGCRDAALGDAAAANVLRETGGQVEALLLDVTDDRSIQAAATTIERRFGRLDGLVNNAGVALDRQVGESLLDRQVGETPLRAMMRATFEVNVFGLACLTEAMIPLLVRSTHPRIVNMSSGLGSLANNSDPAFEFAQVKPPAYNASKSAVTMLTVIYAARLRDQGVKVNAADPGFCATDLNGHTGYRTAAQGAAIAIRLATLDDAGPTGGFFDDAGPVAW